MNRLSLKRGLLLILVLSLILSCTPFAFADTEKAWSTKASMSTKKDGSRIAVLNGKIYSIAGLTSGGSGMTNVVEEYNTTLDTWTTKSPIPTARDNLQVEVLNGKIYALGGYTGGSYLSTLHEYDPSTNIWSQKASMANMRELFQTVVLDGKLYALGGTGSDNKSIEAYDPITDVWTKKASMSIGRRLFQAVVLDGKIYIMGGGSASAEVFDPQTNTCSTISPMNHSRVRFQAAVVDNKIYAIGGGTNTAEVYDPLGNKWTDIASLTTARENFKTIVTDHNIFAIGGDNGSATLSSCEKYDFSTKSWSLINSMNNPRNEFEACLINDNIFVVGGLNSTGQLSSVESYSVQSKQPTLTVTASPNTIKVGKQFTTTVAIHNVSNIYAEDIKINYDSSLFEYVGASAVDGLKIYKEDTSMPGTVRFIIAHLGTPNAANGDKDLINLTFKAKSPGTGKVDVVKGRIADNSTLEMDVADENCGEDTITVEGIKDVNRSGEFTLLDLGIDAGYYGVDASQTDSTKFDADQIINGKIDDNDLASITQSILANTNYLPNTY